MFVPLTSGPNAKQYQYAGFDPRKHSLIVADEFTYECYDVNKWKLVVEGRIISQDVKYQNPSLLRIKCPIVHLSNVSAESQIRDHYDQFTGNSLLKRIVQIDAVAFDGDQNYNRTPVEYLEEREIPNLLCQPSQTPDSDLGMGSSINTAPIGSSMPRISRSSSFSCSGSVSKSGRLTTDPLEAIKRYNQLMRRNPNLNDSLDSIASFRSERLARFVEGMEIRFVEEIAMKGEAHDQEEMIQRDKNPKNRDKNPKNPSNNVTNTPDEIECITLDSD